MTTDKHRTAVITGGNSGIGYATARQLAGEGADVIITGRRKEAVEQAASALNVTGLVADQSKLADIDRLVAEVARRSGKVDILLINAGLTKLETIEAATEDVFDEIMDVNFKGAYFTLSRFIPILNEGASVVLLSSTSAHISPRSASVYAASKAALNAVMKIAASELAPRGIRVNAVSPGPVATEIMRKLGPDKGVEEAMRQSIPLGRFGRPEEVAGLIAYLCGGNASFITGSEFMIDGGQCI